MKSKSWLNLAIFCAPLSIGWPFGNETDEQRNRGGGNEKQQILSQEQPSPRTPAETHRARQRGPTPFAVDWASTKISNIRIAWSSDKAFVSRPSAGAERRNVQEMRPLRETIESIDAEMDLRIEHRSIESIDERELNRAEQGDQPQAMGCRLLT
jgi:hypothetical protein